MSHGIDPAQLDFTAAKVLVTGAAGGIGSAMARAFHAHGAQLLLADRDADGMLALAREVGDARCFEYDQADAGSVERLSLDVGEVDVLLNNAGVMQAGLLLDTDASDIERVIRTNLIGPVLLARALAAGMVARKHGVIVNTASQLAFSGAAERAVYATSKAGLVQFTRAAAAELAPHGVRVVALAPGRSLTPMTQAALSDPTYLARSLAHIPAGRVGEAEEMARLALLLASPLADYVVGETLVADGGYVIS